MNNVDFHKPMQKQKQNQKQKQKNKKQKSRFQDPQGLLMCNDSHKETIKNIK